MKRYSFIFIAIVGFILQGCMPSRMVRQFNEPENYMTSSKNKFLKVHIKDGSLYLLNDWSIDTVTEIITGTGDYYNFRRDRVAIKGKDVSNDNDPLFQICWDDISLLETNQLVHYASSLAAITIVGVPLGIIASICITNPKSCFGSCPTFYTQNNGKWNLVAEGFSSSILPAFEKNDIDMLYWTENSGDYLPVKVTNEALETHMIRYTNLLVFPHCEGTRVYSTLQGDFYSIKDLISPSACEDENGSCLDKTAKMDHIERFSTTDANNLAKKEEIIFSFDNKEGSNRGLIIGSRQTLLTTFLFYQGLAYSGGYAGYFASGVENGNRQMKNGVQNMWDKLGGIEIYLKNKNGNWEKIGEVDEMGPIAADVHLVKLPENIPANATLKLKMTQGLWRIDYLALGDIGPKVSPLIIHPENMFKDEKADPEALKLLNDTSKYLVTYPGDAWVINYKLPGNRNYEYFLESKGYYLEWMRDEWLAEQDLNKARFMFAFPGLFMRKAAKPFKKTESEMEDRFWGSRYVKNE